jgi:hypothetical protein
MHAFADKRSNICSIPGFIGDFAPREAAARPDIPAP